MVAVSGVPTTIVDVVDVVAVRDRDMPAALAVGVGVGVALMDHVPRGGLTFVVVTVMLSMKVTVMYIVDVIAVRDRDMPAAFPVGVIMARVLSVCFGSHGLHHLPARFTQILVAARPRKKTLKRPMAECREVAAVSPARAAGAARTIACSRAGGSGRPQSGKCGISKPGLRPTSTAGVSADLP